MVKKKSTKTKKKATGGRKKMTKETEKKEPETKETNDEVGIAMLQKVQDIVDIVIGQPMPDWLVGLDSPGPTPRDAAYYRLLFEIGQQLKLSTMVDLGTCEGVSALCMAKGNPDGRVYTVDLKNKVDARCRRENIEYVIGDAISEETEEEQTAVPENIDLLYIDIVHTPEAMEKAFDIWTKEMTSGAIIILDGVLWKGASDDMPAWWEGFKPEGFLKETYVDLHSLEGAGTGILIKL